MFDKDDLYNQPEFETAEERKEEFGEADRNGMRDESPDEIQNTVQEEIQEQDGLFKTEAAEDKKPVFVSDEEQTGTSFILINPGETALPAQMPLEVNSQYSYSVENMAKNKKKEKSPFGRFIRRSAAIAFSAAMFGLIAGGTFQAVNRRAENGNSSTQYDAENDAYQPLVDDSTEDGELRPASSQYIVNSTDVSSVVERAMPSVVAINCTGESFSYFFGAQETSGSGSGIIVGQNASEILIVTNNHVITNAKSIEIVFSDGTTAKAVLKGTEEDTDLAVVSVDVNDLSDETLKEIKIASLGSSDDMKMGEMVIAIGNALGYGQSVTVGYVSALDRTVTVDNNELELLQTDAAINPGNSGGALLNVKGEVVGINSLKYAQTDVEGIGFAIPISDVIPIINELMNFEKLDEQEAGYLGITGTDIDRGYAEGFNVPIGYYVRSVEKGSPADQAGLKAYDIITGIDDKVVENYADLQKILSSTKAGTVVELKIMTLSGGAYE